jgi:CheY-like chemotaxis protein
MKKILVVDDESDSRRMMRTFLEAIGHEVIEAEDGYEAVEVALAEKPDLIIMDMLMPLVDGINSTRTMRMHPELIAVPIIALTAFGSFYNSRAYDAGCTEILYKPIDLDKLEPVVTQYVS